MTVATDVQLILQDAVILGAFYISLQATLILCKLFMFSCESSSLEINF